MSDALDSTRIANVAIAIPPAIPVLPAFSFTTIVFVAFWFALFMGVVAAYAADYLDSSFQDPAQISDDLGIPVVVTFPKRTA
jgi:capsular polysaccharide biosynthesis protein